MTIFCFGNEYIKLDSMAKEIGSKLSCEVVMCNSPEEMFDKKPTPPLWILDVAEGIEKPMALTVSQLSTQKLFSLHDFDLAYFLKLMVEMGKVKDGDVHIVAVPMGGKAEDWIEQVEELLKAN